MGRSAGRRAMHAASLRGLAAARKVGSGRWSRPNARSSGYPRDARPRRRAITPCAGTRPWRILHHHGEDRSKSSPMIDVPKRGHRSSTLSDSALASSCPRRRRGGSAPSTAGRTRDPGLEPARSQSRPEGRPPSVPEGSCPAPTFWRVGRCMSVSGSTGD